VLFDKLLLELNKPNYLVK